ncbi:hypothetical protein L798_12441 [Zootermopsis nevadensis]|uniref:Uncharacterized protein n=1 Tax=Zootermopsis nevadensis TaxID=136037 RepID=A0A067R344_ZOONE|nr:hypothetical protein L798_12441 [Zootermopsis nevadensis]
MMNAILGSSEKLTAPPTRKLSTATSCSESTPTTQTTENPTVVGKT